MTKKMDRVAERARTGREDAEMLAGIDQAQLDAMVDAILEAKRIFVAGWGRAGNVGRILSMDCSQIGLETYCVGDNGTPAIQPGDILVISSGLRGDQDNVHSRTAGKRARRKAGVGYGKPGFHYWQTGRSQSRHSQARSAGWRRGSGWLRRLDLSGVQHGGRYRPVLSGGVYEPCSSGYWV